MLTLPEEWRSWNAEHLTRSLFGQIPPGSLRDEFARHLIRTYLDMAAGRGGCTPPRIVDLPDYTWRINDYTFAYLPVVDDAGFARGIELGRRSPYTYLIVPPGCGELLRRAVEPVLKNRTPQIFALDGLISMRVLLTSLDRRCRTRTVFFDVLRRYNERVKACATHDGIFVALPSETA